MARFYRARAAELRPGVVASRFPDTEDRSELVAEVYRRMVERFAADPARYEFHYISLGALLTRV